MASRNNYYVNYKNFNKIQSSNIRHKKESCQQQKNQKFSCTFFTNQFYNYLLLVKQKKNNQMNILSSSQNQSSSQYFKQEEQPDLKVIQNAIKQEIDPEQASQIASKLAVCMKNHKNQKYQLSFKIVTKLIEKGYSKQLSKLNNILQSMMDNFIDMTRKIDTQANSQYKIVCTLSAIAQLMKQAPQNQIGMKKRFLQSLLLIDEELLKVSPIKKNILAVLGVLYQCISKQARILMKFQLTKQFKRAILSNYSQVEQNFSFILFNKALYNLAVQGQQLTQAELAKYNVILTLSKVVGPEKASFVISKIKQALQKQTIRKNKPLEIKKSQMVAQC